MKTLYIDCGMGAAGDMLTAALIELLPDPDGFVKKLNSIGIPDVIIEKEKAVKCGITGTHISVKVGGVEEDEHLHDHHHDHEDCEHSHEEHDHDHDHCHDHEDCEHSHEEHDHAHDHHHHHDHDHEEHDYDHHEHAHHHHHSSMADIEHIVRGHMHLPEKVADDVMKVYALIAEAEGHVHDRPVTEIHFHEVGTMDAIADITAVCMLMNEIAPDEVVVSPVHVGSGTVKCAHGILPVPAPATAHILRGIPTYGGEIRGELCTPTGAALLKYFATRFDKMPMMITRTIGYGMGKKDFPIANCVRVMLGESENKTDLMSELSCNVDDMTAEEIGYAMERLFDAGAREVFTIPVGMKKCRPGTLIKVICSPEQKDKLIEVIFKNTSTIGIRETLTNRYILDRKISTVSTKFGDVRVKESSGYGVNRKKFEYDDLSRIAKEQNLSITEVRNEIEN